MARPQRLQAPIDTFEQSRRRFNLNDPPPPYSATNRSIAPVSASPFSRSEQADEEIISRPLTNEELYTLGCSTDPYHAGYRYKEENDKEQDRIVKEYFARDQLGRRLWRGPDLTGHAGAQRLSIIARHRIKQSWQKLKLNCWNPTWGIPGVDKDKDPHSIVGWQWLWHNDDEKHHQMVAYHHDDAKWPAPDRETATHREIRLLLERKGHWGDRSEMISPSGPNHMGTNIHPSASFITSRPWYKFKLEVAEESLRLERSQSITNGDLQAEKNVKARWRALGVWDRKWDKDGLIGWTWRREHSASARSNQADLDVMELTPSEKDAMENIDPDTPPATGSANFPYPPPWKHVRILGPHFTATPLIRTPYPLAPPVENNPSTDTQADTQDVNSDREADSMSHVIDRTAQVNQNAGIATGTRAGKRKRQDEDRDEDVVHEADENLPRYPASTFKHRKKRLRFADTVRPTTSEVSNGQPSRAGPVKQRTPKESLIIEPGSAEQDSEARSGPRRSARIQARKGTNKTTLYDGLVKQESSVRNKSRPKSPKRKKFGDILTSRDGLQRTTRLQTGRKGKS